MLGVARHAQLAGWGTRPPAVAFTATSDLSYTVSQNQFSFLVNPSPSLYRTGGGSPAIDLTGLTSATGYHTRRYTIAITFYLEWASGLSNANYATYAGRFAQGGTDTYHTISFNVTSGKLDINDGYASVPQSLQTTDAYTNYTNRWLTLVCCSAETSTPYSGWTVTGFGDNYLRTCLYDTETGELLVRRDQRANGVRVDYGTYGNTLSTENGSNQFECNFFSSGYPTTQYHRLAGVWAAYGQVWDPLTVTDTSWRTTRPSKTIGGVDAWYNWQFVNYERLVDGGDERYYLEDTPDDRYSQADDRIVYFTDQDEGWDPNYSTTIIPKDRG